jgi:uroporphyrinogen decarboxylase
MVDLLLEPELAATLVNEVAKVIFGLTEIYLDSVGHELDILEFPGDDYAGNVNPIISRELFDRFFKPYWRRLVEMAKHGWPMSTSSSTVTVPLRPSSRQSSKPVWTSFIGWSQLK